MKITKTYGDLVFVVEGDSSEDSFDQLKKIEDWLETNREVEGRADLSSNMKMGTTYDTNEIPDPDSTPFFTDEEFQSSIEWGRTYKTLVPKPPNTRRLTNIPWEGEV